MVRVTLPVVQPTGGQGGLSAGGLKKIGLRGAIYSYWSIKSFTFYGFCCPWLGLAGDRLGAVVPAVEVLALCSLGLPLLACGPSRQLLVALGAVEVGSFV
jgi:hypothetical protein